jgi:hypothetical protein
MSEFRYARTGQGTTDELPAAQFAVDVHYYLLQSPRQLPSRYFYDELGSALFEAICRLPWYRITRAESRLLAAHGSEVFRRVGSASTIVELGSGSGEKLRLLIEAGGPHRTELDVHLVDVSASALESSARMLGSLDDVGVTTHQATYEAGLAEVARQTPAGADSLVLFLGSNIGNFDPPGAEEFLRGIRANLAAGDALLLGADLVKPESDLLLAYDDPLGVTAAFNRNLLVPNQPGARGRLRHRLLRPPRRVERDRFARRDAPRRESAAADPHRTGRARLPHGARRADLDRELVQVPSPATSSICFSAAGSASSSNGSTRWIRSR